MLFFFTAIPVNSSSFLNKLREKFSINIPEKILNLVNDSILGKIKAKEIKYLLPDKVDLYDIEIVDENGGRILFSKKISLKVSLTSLLTKNFTITEALVEEPYLNYVIKGDVDNIIRAFTPKKPKDKDDGPANFKITAQKISVKNGRFLMSHSSGIDISAHGVETQGSFWVGPQTFLVDLPNAQIMDAKISVNQVIFPITSIVAQDLKISDQDILVNKLTALYEKAKVEAKGRVDIKNEEYHVIGSIIAPKNAYPKGLKQINFELPNIKADISLWGKLDDPKVDINASFGDFILQGFHINNGTFLAQANKNDLSIKEAVLFLGNDKWIKAHGWVNYKDSSKGVAVFTQGQAKNFNFEDVVLSGSTEFILQTLITNDDKIYFKKIDIKNPSGISIIADGDFDLNDEKLNINFNAIINKPEEYFKSIKDIADFRNINAKGKWKLINKKNNIIAYVELGNLIFKNMEGKNIKSQVEFREKDLLLKNIKGQAFLGEFHGDLNIYDIYKYRNLSGVFNISNGDISNFFHKDENNLKGNFFADLVLSGSAKAPKILIDGGFKELFFRQAFLGNGRIKAELNTSILNINELEILSNSLFAKIDNANINLENDEIFVPIKIYNSNLSDLLKNYNLKATGHMKGDLKIGGKITDPKLSSSFFVNDFGIMNFYLGDGIAKISLEKLRLLNSHKSDEVLSVMMALKNENENNNIQFSLATEEKTIHFFADINKVNFNIASQLSEKINFGVNGSGKTTIKAQGQMDDLNASLMFNAQDFTFAQNQDLLNETEAKDSFGPLIIDAKLESKKIKADFCANINKKSHVQTCEKDLPLILSIDGPFTFEDFILNFVWRMEVNSWSNILPFLKNELMDFKTSTIVNGTLVKKPRRDLVYDLDLNLNSLKGTLPGLSLMELEKPVNVVMSRQGIRLQDNALINFFPGSLDISGGIKGKMWDISLDGAIPLILARPFLKGIKRAQGNIYGSLKVLGEKTRPKFDGFVRFADDAMITPKKYLDSIYFKSGDIKFSSNPEKGFSAKINDINLQMGEGNANLDGIIENIDSNNNNINLFIYGDNILLKEGKNYVDTDFSLSMTKNTYGAHSLNGQVTVNSALFTQNFDLRNFVAEAKKPQRSQNIDFSNSMDALLGVKININDFSFMARIMSIYLDSSLSGELSLDGSLKMPKMNGSLLLKEGKIAFPAVDMDLSSSVIELDKKSSIFFDPIINISTQKLLEKKDFLNIAQDTGVEVALNGTIDKMNFSLKALSGDTSLTQFRLLLLLLSPRVESREINEGETMRRVAEEAARAVSREVLFRPLTSEVENFLAGVTKTKVQLGGSIEPGGWSFKMRWELSPRMEIQINQMRREQQGELSASDIKFSQDLRLLLYLYDHKPWGPLSLETMLKFQENKDKNEQLGKIRLKYDILGP